MKKTLTALILFAAVCPGMKAQVFSTINSAPDAASLATGCLNSSNPATFSLQGRAANARVQYGRWSPSVSPSDVVNTYAAVSLGRTGLELRARGFFESTYELADENGKMGGTFRGRESLFSMGASRMLSDNLAAGARINWVNLRYSPQSRAFFPAADIFLAYRRDKLKACLSVNNLSGVIDLGGREREHLCTMASLNGEYSLLNGPVFHAEADFLTDGAFMGGAGISYRFGSIAEVRGGWHFGNSVIAINSYAALGASLHFRGISADFALMLASKTLGGGFITGISYEF